MRHFILTIIALATAINAAAQQNVGFQQGNLVSPQVNADNTVTFRLKADKAKQAMVLGDWEADGGKGQMKKAKDGTWVYTTAALPSEMYTYRFAIDGVVGLDPVNPFTRRDVGNVFSIFYVPGGAADYYQVRDVPHGDMTTTWYHSNAAAADRRMSVYLPPHYGKENKSYPVLYLLHGSGGDETAWTDLGHVARIMDNLIAEGKAEPMIVVMPNGNFSKQAAPGETSEGLAYKPVMTNMLPKYKNGEYELAFMEIVNYVDAKYRTLPDKGHRAVAGLSMGGMHTLFIALNHPQCFDYVALFSAGLRLNENNPDYAAYADIDGKIDRLKQAGYKMFWIGIGTDDFLYEANQKFIERLRQHDFRFTYHESRRGHIWSNWRQYLLEVAPQLFK